MTFIPTWWAAKAVGPQLCHHDGDRKEADPHEDLLHKYTGGHLKHVFCRLQGDPHLFLNDKGDADKIIPFHHRKNAHEAGDDRSKYRGQGRSGDPKPGKAQISLDQQVVSDHIDHIGGHIGAHGDLCVSCSSLGRVNGHGDNVEHHPAHDDLEIPDGSRLGILVCPAEPDDGICKEHAGHTDQRPHRQGKGRCH